MRFSLTTLVSLLMLVPVGAGATTPGDLCTGDPCVVDKRVAVDIGSEFDFGPTHLIVLPSLAVSVYVAPRNLGAPMGRF